jgi:hypothetical protein
MKRGVYICAAAAFGYLLLWRLSPPQEIHTRIWIAADSEQVWSVLVDGRAYPDWNPFIRRLDGTIAVDRRIAITLTSRRGETIRFSPIVTRMLPGRELRWLGRLAMPGLLDGEHYFLLSPLTGGRTLLTHGERFTGILPWMLGVETFREDFEALNHALAARAEARARKS